MPAPNTISIDKLVRLLGTPKCPTLIDIRLDDELAAHPYLIPSSRHRTLEQFIQTGLDDRRQPGVHHLHLTRIVIDTHDLMAVARQRGRGDRADVAQPENTDAHVPTSRTPGAPSRVRSR